MPSPARRHSFVPRLDALEPRDVPAGNVTVTAGVGSLGTYLGVLGDAAANSITVTGLGPGVVKVQGNANTTINGSNAPVTVSGVVGLTVRAEGGNDTIRTQNLSVDEVEVNGGGGNNLLDVQGTRAGILSAAEPVLKLSLFVGTGDDTLRLTGTRFQGELAQVSIIGGGGRNTIDVSDNRYLTTGPAGGLVDLFVYGDPSGVFTGKNDITVDGLTVGSAFPATAPERPNTQWYVTLYGGADDDRIRLRNSTFTASSNVQSGGRLDISGDAGRDTVEVTDTTMTGPPANQPSPYNHLQAYVTGERVKLRDLRYGTGYSADAYAFLLVAAADGDLQGVDVTSPTGGAQLNLYSGAEFYTDPAAYSLKDVNVRGGTAEYTWATLVGGDDTVTVADSDLGEIYFDLKEGADRVTFTNVAFSAPYPGIDTGFGNDTVVMTGCTASVVYLYTANDNYGAADDDTVRMTANTFGTVEVYTGQGDDAVTLTNNSVAALTVRTWTGNDVVTLTGNAFGTAYLYGEYGIDRLRLTNNTGLIVADGFEQ